MTCKNKRKLKKTKYIIMILIFILTAGGSFGKTRQRVTLLPQGNPGSRLFKTN
jgi:hypothetical protein